MILDDIVQRTEKRVAQLPTSFPEPVTRKPVSLSAAIRGKNKKNAVIAEIKCASPIRGVIRRNVDMAQMAGVLAGAGCVAFSVLTEPYFFGGTGQDIARVKSAVDIPVLRKDFIIDERQIAESRALGADAVLLIAAVLKERLPDFVDRGPYCCRSRSGTWHTGSAHRYQQPRPLHHDDRSVEHAAALGTDPPERPADCLRKRYEVRRRCTGDAELLRCVPDRFIDHGT